MRDSVSTLRLELMTSRASFVTLCALTEILTVPKNMKLVALPLFELYDNAVR